MIYRVTNWKDHFENNKSKQWEKCSYVCVPNKQHGMSFTRLLSEPDGATIYGIWQLILGAVSRQGKHRDGWLTDDGHRAGTAWTPQDLAAIWRRPVAEIERALQVLSNPRIGWISAVTETSAYIEDSVSSSNSDHNTAVADGARTVPAQCPSGGLEQNRTEQNRITPPAFAAGEESDESFSTQPPSRPGHRRSEAPKTPTEEALRFAKWFRESLPVGFKLTPSVENNWAIVYDEMIRLDGRTKEEIAAVCRWARRDEFWAQNFLSPVKLRQKKDGVMWFDAFVEKMKAPPRRGALNGAERKAAEAYREYAMQPHEMPTVINLDDEP